MAICDDEMQVSAKLENTLTEILDNQNIKHEIDVYFTGEELWSKMMSGTNYDLIFLDIEFAKNAINGVEVGKLIRDANNNAVSIVFISWEAKYSMQLFDIRPLNFLVKPLEHEMIERVVMTFLHIHRLWADDFTYKVGHSVFKLQIKDIIYLESLKRKLFIHLADGRTEEFYGTLKDTYQEQLQRFDFLFIHASYIVNYDFITSVKYNELTLTNNTTLPISQQRKKEIREKYFSIMKKRTLNVRNGH